VLRSTLVLLAALAAPALAQTTSTWEIDPAHSSIQFGVRHLMISTVKGKFPKFTATAVADEKEPTRAVVEASIDTASIDTGEAKRDEHLRSPDFFDTEHHPTVSFRSTKVEDVGGGSYRLTGDLTIKDVTKPVTLDLEYLGTISSPWGDQRAGFSATTEVSRKEWGLEWNVALEAGGVVVGDKVRLSIDAEAILQK